jgi:hypothetical protein
MTAEARTDRPGLPIGTPRRRFRLLDAMILVAATAAGCVAMRWVVRKTDGAISWAALYEAREYLPRNPQDFLRVSSYIAAGLLLPLVTVWTLALIPLRLLAPRLRFRRLARQPGMMAAWASCVTLVFLGLQVLLVALILGRGDAADLLEPDSIIASVPMFVALAVSASWITLLLGRRWRADSDWIDRFGRALGVFWIVAGFAMTGIYLWQMSLGSRCAARSVNSSPYNP